MNREAGFVQIWSLLLLVLMGSAANLAVGRADRLRTSRLADRARVRGLYAAEAGIAEARVLVRDGERQGTFELRVGGVTVQLELEPTSTGSVRARSQAILWPSGRNGLAHRATVRVLLAPMAAELPRILERHESERR